MWRALADAKEKASRLVGWQPSYSRSVSVLANPTTQSASTTVSSKVLHDLPFELLLNVVDFTLEDSRHGDASTARRLSCVSRALRAYTLPVIYEVLIIDISKVWSSSLGMVASNLGSIVGHDGREYEYRNLAMLSFLLLDLTAEPRKYIKNIYFRNTVEFSVSDLLPYPGWKSSMNWVIDRLVVPHRRDAVQLHELGIRAREVHTFKVWDFQSEAVREPFKWMVLGSGHLDDFNENSCGHLRCWLSGVPGEKVTQKPNEWKLQDAEAITKRLSRTLVGVVHRQLDPSEDHRSVALSDITRRGQFFFIEFHGYLEISKPEILVKNIASILQHQSNQHIVLVHASDDDTAADQVTAIVAVAKDILPLALRGRLRVSHSSWGRNNLLRNPTRTYLNLMRRGIDPWNVGYIPAVLQTR